MITIEAGAQAFVGTSAGEVLVPVGSWILPDATYVTVGTNGQVSIPNTTRDGAIVFADANGLVRIQDGPDLIGSSVAGFALALTTLGIFMGIRWTWRKIMGAIGVSHAID